MLCDDTVDQSTPNRPTLNTKQVSQSSDLSTPVYPKMRRPSKVDQDELIAKVAGLM